MSNTPDPTRKAPASCDWLHFVARSGEQGRSWAAAYKRHLPLFNSSVEALEDLRSGRLEAGEQRLRRLREDLRSLRFSLPPSVRHVLERWVHGVEGYRQYRRGRWSEARESMFRAHRAVTAAVSRQRFLMPLAHHCHEFCLHQARIARNQRDWEAMERAIDNARAMMDGHRPLCRPKPDPPVYITTLAELYENLAPLSEAEQSATRFFFDAAYRRRQFDRFVRSLRVLPGFAIPYTPRSR
jgi:hypothetical protein